MKNWRRTSCTLVSLTLSVFVFAQNAYAEELLKDTQDTAVATNLGLYGGSPQDIAVDPNNDGQNVYVTTYTPNGLFTSTDGGATWTGLSNEVDYGAGKGIAIDPDTSDVYVTIGDNVVKSTDQGTTWTKLTSNLFDFPIVGEPIEWADGTLVLAVSGGAVQVSQDGGETFTEVELTGDTEDSVVSIAGDTDGTFYAVVQNNSTSANRFYFSTDNAVTWTELDVNAVGVAEGSEYYSVLIDPLNSDHLILTSFHPDYFSYQSFDAGASWTALLNAGSRIGGKEGAFDGVGGLYLGMYYTSDASTASPTWSSVSSDTPLSSVVGDIYAVDPIHPTTVFSNSPMGVAKSEDNGANWVDSVQGITAVKGYAISQADDKDIVWIGADGGLAKTTNFTDAEPDWDYPVLPSESAGTIYTVWVKPTNGNFVVTGSSEFIYYSEDGGDTWTLADTPSMTGTVQAIVPSPRNNQTLYAMYVNTSLTDDAFDGGVLKSSDSGKTWEELDFPTTLADGALAVAEQNDRDVVYVGIGSGGNETGIYKYSQGEWTKVDEEFNGLYVNNVLVHPNDSNLIFASFEASSTVGSLFKSIDGGDTWTELTTGLENANHLGALVVQTGTADVLYLAGQDNGTNFGMLYKSTDAGETWSEFYQGKRQEFFYALLFDGLVSGNDRGVFNLKSLAKVGLQKKHLVDNEYSLTVTLKDAATKELLLGKKVRVFKKPKGKDWREVQVKETNENGVAKFTVTAKKGAKIKVVWKPRGENSGVYARSTSRILTID